MSWLEMIVTVLSELGGDAPYKDLYDKMLEFYPDKMSEVKDYKAQIRGTIEQFSSDSEVYQKNKYKINPKIEGIFFIRKIRDIGD